MKISFHRRYEFKTRIQERVRVFYLSAGFAGEIDPDSGMSFSLVEMDQKIGFLCRDLSQEKYKDQFDLSKRVRADLEVIGVLAELEIRPRFCTAAEPILKMNSEGKMRELLSVPVQVRFNSEDHEMLLEFPGGLNLDFSQKKINLDELIKKGAVGQSQNFRLSDPLNQREWVLESL